jgi:UDP-N-acetyl-2-amino-2-deoxyglucuronate dehydrogenase
MKNFAVTGVGGYIAPRHLRAIRDTGNRVVAAVDPKDSVGILDQFAFDIRFFTEIERFDRHLQKVRHSETDRVDFMSICSPNYLHDAHCRIALRSGADAICEKPLVINPWNLDALRELEEETGRRVFTILQLRVHDKLIELRNRLRAESGKRRQVRLTYITVRGGWYHVSWKGSEDKSGGIATNIGIHFFDLLIWLFGSVSRSVVHVRTPERMAGALELERADVSWYLSLQPDDLPFEPQPGKKSTFRSITVDGEEIEFSEGFTDLHTRSYEEVLAGRGFGIDDVKPATELVHGIRNAALQPEADGAHPFVSRDGRSLQ